MKTAKQIREKCEEDIKKLQKICPHKQFTWGEEQWAPAHSTGRRLKWCNRCEKILEIENGEKINE